MSVAPCAASSKGKEKRGDGAISRIFQGEDCEGGAQRFRGQVERVVPIGVATRARGRTSGLERLVARVDGEGRGGGGGGTSGASEVSIAGRGLAAVGQVKQLSVLTS
jgi:hypothetical protein